MLLTMCTFGFFEWLYIFLLLDISVEVDWWVIRCCHSVFWSGCTTWRFNWWWGFYPTSVTWFLICLENMWWISPCLSPFLYLSYLNLCVFMRMHMYWGGGRLCACLWRPEDNLKLCLSPTLVFWDRVSHWPGTQSSMAEWLVKKPQRWGWSCKLCHSLLAFFCEFWKSYWIHAFTKGKLFTKCELFPQAHTLCFLSFVIEFILMSSRLPLDSLCTARHGGTCF